MDQQIADFTLRVRFTASAMVASTLLDEVYDEVQRVLDAHLDLAPPVDAVEIVR